MNGYYLDRAATTNTVCTSTCASLAAALAAATPAYPFDATNMASCLTAAGSTTLKPSAIVCNSGYLAAGAGNISKCIAKTTGCATASATNDA
jgi:hypothetical protein